MRILLTLALPALLLAAPVNAQGWPQAATGREAEAGDLGPLANLVGTSIVYRHQPGTVGIIRQIVTGDQGRPKLVVALADGGRQVILDPAEIDRRGTRIQLMLDPGQIPGLPGYPGGMSGQ